MYSGYINLPNTQKYYHYIFVPSTGKPATDPVVLWLNGGPGCSSLDGFFYEHGPYKFGPGLENITLDRNPYAYVFSPKRVPSAPLSFPCLHLARWGYIFDSTLR